MVLKVSENLRDSEQIRKIRLNELESVRYIKNNTNLTNNSNYNSDNLYTNNREKKQLEYDDETSLSTNNTAKLKNDSPTPVRLFILPSLSSSSSITTNKSKLHKTKVVNTDINRF